MYIYIYLIYVLIYSLTNSHAQSSYYAHLRNARTAGHQALRQLNSLKTRPGFLRYLSFIFNCSTNNVSLQIRCVAGLYLKTGLRKCQITNDLIAIRAEALSRVSDPIKPIRNTASSIINCIVKRCKLKSWPQLLPRIVRYRSVLMRENIVTDARTPTGTDVGKP